MDTGVARRKRKGGRRRAALAAWLLCSILAGSIGAYEFAREAREAKAATEFSMKTGYYMGTGASLSITGLGFTPEAVIVKWEGGMSQQTGPWLKTTAMPSSVTGNLGDTSNTINVESQITLNADGFTLSAANAVNIINSRFVYVAFAGSDCTSGGSMCIGSYTGTGAASLAVSTGFQPDLVWVRRAYDTSGSTASSMFRTSAMSANHAAYMGYGDVNNTTGIFFQTLDSNGFTVGATNNTVNSVYYFVAFKTLAGKLSVGSFAGNGTDNRDITGVGFEPDFVVVKQNSAVYPVMNITESFGDLSVPFGSGSSAGVNHIQELKSDGFQVGNSTSVNANGITSHYFAFGGAPDPAPAGSYQMQRGSYIGNATAQTIDLSFRPDLVIIKGDTAQNAVWTTSVRNDRTMFFDNNAAFTGGITAMGAASFSVGSHATVNANLINYEFVAFGNATTPHRGNGAADFTIGVYSGNGISGRVIDHLGFTPALLATAQTSSTWTSWKTSSPTMAANTTAFLASSADSTNGTYLQALTSNGFTLGNDSSTNSSSTSYIYIWFAFADSANFSVGSYTGNGTAGTNITGLGFDPDWVFVKRDTSAAGAHRSTSASITGQYSQYFTSTANATNRITGFVTDGFTVGNSTDVNASAGVYRYAAWKRTTSANPPATPTNSTPADAATRAEIGSTVDEPET